jgi:hypothetical protein
MRKLAQQSHLVASELPGSPHQLRITSNDDQIRCGDIRFG